MQLVKWGLRKEHELAVRQRQCPQIKPVFVVVAW